ncbi:transposase family protein [Streptomyces mirabilis]|uniref:transposase family protein n=1 Tax=Streptomyces mirabilis TaxID=68239 RepID=UPI0036B9142D
MPGPRDPRGVRHALVVMLALTACAVLAGATSLPAVGEWITDAPPSVLERLGVRPDPLSPKRCLRRRRRCVGCWAASTEPRWTGRWPPAGRRAGADGRLHAVAVDGKTLRRAARAHGAQDSSARRLRPPLRPGPGLSGLVLASPAWSWPHSTLVRRPTRSPASSLCWRPAPIWRAWS